MISGNVCAAARHTLAFGTTSVQPDGTTGGSQVWGGRWVVDGWGRGVGGKGGREGAEADECFCVVLCVSHRLAHNTPPSILVHSLTRSPT
jgi:hypothetical protein